jgi:hypothetical protein
LSISISCAWAELHRRELGLIANLLRDDLIDGGAVGKACCRAGVTAALVGAGLELGAGEHRAHPALVIVPGAVVGGLVVDAREHEEVGLVGLERLEDRAEREAVLGPRRPGAEDGAVGGEEDDEALRERRRVGRGAHRLQKRKPDRSAREAPEERASVQHESPFCHVHLPRCEACQEVFYSPTTTGFL